MGLAPARPQYFECNSPGHTIKSRYTEPADKGQEEETKGRAAKMKGEAKAESEARVAREAATAFRVFSAKK